MPSTPGKSSRTPCSEFHRLISREGARLSTLIENVLDFARIEQGRKRWHFEECDLAAVVTETLASDGTTGHREEHHARFSQTASQPDATVDPGAIQQALVNLLDNAIKFSPAGSSRGNSLSRESAHPLGNPITDQGPGIPPAEHARIFESSTASATNSAAKPRAPASASAW